MDLQGLLLYFWIEHRSDARRFERVPDDETFIPYAHLLHDPRLDREAALKLAA